MKNVISEINQIVNSEKRVNGYYAIVLDEKSKEQVEALSIYPIIKAHHITIAFNPTKTESEIYNRMLGKTFNINVDYVAHNDRIQALSVKIDGIQRMDGGYDHITVSHVAGAKPVESNTMLVGKNNKKKVSLVLKGKLEFISFE